jgi:hypothetical protein
MADHYEKIADDCSASDIFLPWRRFAMTRIRVLFVVALMAVSSLATAQDSMKKGDRTWTDLEKQLADINDQWVCAHKYHKDHAQDCVDFKNKIWPDTFFEISRQGKVEDKQEMVKRQTATATSHPVSPGVAGPNPQDFKLMAVYGDVALATDRTVFKVADDSGKISVRNEATVLRMFVRLNGKWVPAGAALVPVK